MKNIKIFSKSDIENYVHGFILLILEVIFLYFTTQ